MLGNLAVNKIACLEKEVQTARQASQVSRIDRHTTAYRQEYYNNRTANKYLRQCCTIMAAAIATADCRRWGGAVRGRRKAQTQKDTLIQTYTQTHACV